MPWRWLWAMCRRNKPAGGLACRFRMWQRNRARSAPRWFPLDCQTKFGPAAQRVAGCRASYPRVDRFAVTRTMKTSLLRFFLLIASASMVAGATLSGPTPSGAKLTFRRVFKGSSPEFIEITVREDSDTAAYEIPQLAEDARSLPFKARPPCG